MIEPIVFEANREALEGLGDSAEKWELGVKEKGSRGKLQAEKEGWPYTRQKSHPCRSGWLMAAAFLGVSINLCRFLRFLKKSLGPRSTFGYEDAPVRF